MSSPMQQPENWSLIATGYQSRWDTFGRAFSEEALRLLAPATSAHLLDIGTGTGGFARLAARRVARVVAVDFAPGMIEATRAATAAEGIANLDAAVMDAQALDLPDASFDCAASLFAFMFLPDRARALAELHRVLRPGGTIVIGTWAPIDRRPAMKIGFDAAAEMFPGAPLPSKGDLQTDEDCLAELRAAGFRDVAVTHFTSAVTCRSGAEYLDVTEPTSIPMQLMKQKLGPGWAGARAKLAEAIDRRLPPDGVLSAEALFTVARK